MTTRLLPRSIVARLITAIVLASAAMLAPQAFSGHGAGAAPVPVGHPGMGFLSNMDVLNETGATCEGFDIQIEDVTPDQAPYQYYGTYGKPTITSMTFPDGHSGIDVRWAASYGPGSWTASTAPGAQEHFGVYVTVQPGNQNLTWLCDVNNNGTLTPYGGTATGNGYTNNTIVNPPVPQVTTQVIATPQGEQVKQTLQDGPSNAATTPDAVYYYRYQQNTTQTPKLDQLTPDNGLAVSAMTSSQINDALNLVDGGGTETATAPASEGTGGSVWVVQTYAYTGPYDDAHHASCDTNPNLVGNLNCGNDVGPLLSTTVLSTNLANGGNRWPVNVIEKTGTVTSNAGGTVTSNDLTGANGGTNYNANPGNIDCGATCTSVVDQGAPVVLTATPKPGYAFTGWSGDCKTTSTTCSVTPTRIQNVTASFVKTFAVIQAKSATTGYTGHSVLLTIKGSSFNAQTTASISGSDVTVSNLSVAGSGSSTTATIVATISAKASAGLRDVTLSNPNGATGTCSSCLSIIASPTPSSATPSSVAHHATGNTITLVSLTGTGFVPGAAVTLSGTGVKATVTATTSTSMTISITVAKTAATGPRTLTVTNPDKGTGSIVITVV